MLENEAHFTATSRSTYLFQGWLPGCETTCHIDAHPPSGLIARVSKHLCIKTQDRHPHEVDVTRK